MDISTQGMKYVCALATHLNFHKAAKECCTSQPNLSTQIKKIEKECGFPIFERTHKFVKTTQKGHRVVSLFQSILEKIDSIPALGTTTSSGLLTVGIFPTLAPYLLPHIMHELKKSCPTLKLSIIEDKTERICTQLEQGQLDCIIAAHPLSHTQFDHTRLFDDLFFIAMSSDNPLAQKKELSISELKQDQILLLEEGHCLRDQSLGICQNHSLPLNLNYQSSSLETLRAMVAGQSGITFIPDICRDTNPLITYLPIKDAQYSRTIALYWRPSTPMIQLIHRFSKIIVDAKNTISSKE